MKRHLVAAILLFVGSASAPGCGGADEPGDGGVPGDFHTGPAGVLRILALDDETGLPLPSRVIITAVPPTAPVTFDNTPGATGIGLAPGVIGAPEGVLLLAGDGAFRVPVGTYDLFVTHGPEWEAHSERVTLAETAGVTVTAPLRHSVDTRGWLAADLHVHTGRSYDSKLRVGDRVISEVSVGVELIVTTDHNVLSDLQPEVDSLGYSELARALVGDEFNFREGHGGAYPMPYDDMEPFGGTMKWGLDWTMVKDVTAAQVFAQMHAFPTKPVVTVNHPRLLPDLGYFINMTQYGPRGWSPPTPLPTAGMFEGLEVLNGYMDQPAELGVLMRDWFFLLSSGHRVTAIGSSDTHRLSGVKAGFPRTWLRVATEKPKDVMGADLAEAVKQGRAVASNGPFAALHVGAANIGDLVTLQGGSAPMDVTVDAPSWIDLDHVRVYVNGQKVKEFAVAPGKRPRFHESWSQPLPPGDGWLTIEASGSKPLPSGLVGDPGALYTPLVITNPVYFDGDGDGQWTPQIAEPDPGPKLPFAPPWFPADDGWAPSGRAVAPARNVPEDCEPPLWTNPSTWVNP